MIIFILIVLGAIIVLDGSILGIIFPVWIRLTIVEIFAFTYGFFSDGGRKGSYKTTKGESVITGFIYAVVLAILLFLGALLYEPDRDVTIIEIPPTREHSKKERMVYFVEHGERYHKSTECPTLHSSDIIYKAYREDTGNRTSCGVCNPH